MPECTIELSKSLKQRWVRACKRLGTDEETLTALLDTHRDFDKVSKDRDKFEAALKEEKEAFSDLEQQTLQNSAGPGKKTSEKNTGTAKSTDLNALKILSDTLESTKSMLDFYARENQRLLEKVNHSEYDERILSLQNQTEAAKKTAETYKANRDNHSKALQASKKLVYEQKLIIKSFSERKTTDQGLIEKKEKIIQTLNATISQNNTVITAQSSQIEKFKILPDKSRPGASEANQQPN